MEESGISVENEHLTNFRSAILKGEWDKVLIYKKLNMQNTRSPI
jgi:hypothetical protein